LIEMDPNASIDEVHRFAGAGRKLMTYERGEDTPGSHYSPLYQFGNHSFHAGTIKWENIPERFDKQNIQSLGTISSENELGYDLPIEQAVNTLNEFLLDGGKREGTRFSDNPRKLVDAILADEPIVSDGRLLTMPAEEQRKEAWRIYDGLRNETVRTQDGRVVHFYRRGFNETRYHSADSHTLAIIPILKETIASAHLFYNGDKSARDGNDRSYHLYARKVNLGDGERIARIVIREDKNGNMYYDSESTSVETLKEILDQGYPKPNQAQGRESPYATHSLAELFGEVNQNPSGGGENRTGVRFSASDVTVDPSGVTVDVAKKHLVALAGKPLRNLATGIVAEINSRQRNKIVSNSAVRKSVKNGFAPAQHNAAVSIIENLWKHAEQVSSNPDRNGDANIKSIKRFASIVYFGDREAFAYLTAKEPVDSKHKLYSIELEKLESMGGKLNGRDHSAPMDSGAIIEKLRSKVKENLPDGEENGTASRFSISERNRKNRLDSYASPFWQAFENAPAAGGLNLPNRMLAASGVSQRGISPNEFLYKARQIFPELAIRRENKGARIGRRYLGYFVPSTLLVRSKDADFFNTICHEIGHHLEHLNRTKNAIPKAAVDELVSMGKALYGKQQPTGGYAAEGFAEFIRGWATASPDLSSIAPETLAWFEHLPL
ncbi:MAG: hypothetical protein ACI4X9_03485, partial [Kiritimatiellia bacterium]